MFPEIYVFFSGPLPERTAVNAMFNALHFPFALPGQGALEGHRGFMPMRLQHVDTGFEFDVFDNAEMLALMAGAMDAAFDRSVTFRWSGDDEERLAALCTAAALATMLGAVVLDDEAVSPFSAEEAVEKARGMLKWIVPQLEGERAIGFKGGTSPIHLREYLRPLLEARKDLVLVDRYLVMRPVRHVLRGAALGRYDRYAVDIHRLLMPMYDPTVACTSYDQLPGAWEIWEPHFQPLLLDQLREQVFTPLASVTSLSDFARVTRTRKHPNGEHIIALVRSLLLAGEAEQAAAFVEEGERSANGEHEAELMRKLRGDLDRDIADMCADHHRREADMASVLKLKAIWEPTPFPVELPKASRAARTDEAPFPLAPWAPLPDDLYGALPEELDVPVFSKRLQDQGDAFIRLVPLSREDAEQRHEAHDRYCMVVRLSPANLLTIHYGVWDQANPGDRRDAGMLAPLDVFVNLRTPGWGLHASFKDEQRDLGRMGRLEIIVHDLERHIHVWQTRLDATKGVRVTKDQRRGKSEVETPMSDTEMAPWLTPVFPFGDYWTLLRRIEACARLAGHGPLPGVPPLAS